jgi:hypothetical protein
MVLQQFLAFMALSFLFGWLSCYPVEPPDQIQGDLIIDHQPVFIVFLYPFNTICVPKTLSDMWLKRNNL